MSITTICPECQRGKPPNEVCPYCGYDENRSFVHQRFCPYCKRELLSYAVVCHYCGQDLPHRSVRPKIAAVFSIIVVLGIVFLVIAPILLATH